MSAKRLHIGVMGAGAVGCFVGGKLIASDEAEVTLVGRPKYQDEITQYGLSLEDLDCEPAHIPAGDVRYETEAAALASCDVVLVAVKSGQTKLVASELKQVLATETLLVSLQNGVRNAEVLRKFLEPRPVLGGIVEFNVVSLGNATFRRATDGALILEESPTERGERLFSALRQAGLALTVEHEIRSQQWTKLLVNLSNAVSALSGAPTRDLLLRPGYRRIIAAVLSEGIEVLKAAGIPVAKLRGLPVGVMPTVLRMPTPLVRMVTGRQIKVDPEARSSMWQDLTMGRPTEIDYLNGEIVRIARKAGVEAPINKKIVELVHGAEESGVGSPQLDPEHLWNAVCSPA